MIGLFGGTFDPVHRGHIALADSASQQLDLHKVIFIPLGLPPHRDLPQVTASSRVDMLQAALTGHANFEVSTVEIDRAEPSWTVHTLEYFTQRYPQEILCLLMGSDAFGGINEWYRWQDLLDYCHIVVVSRAGDDLQFSQEVAAYLQAHRLSASHDLVKCSHGGIYLLETDIVDVSSTRVRESIAAGASLSGLLPPAVEKLIKRNGYYGYQ